MRHTARALLAVLLLPLAAGIPITGAAEQETATPEQGPTRVHPEAREAIDRLKSPFCPGFMLEVCPSPQAEELRDSLDARARRGVESDSLVAMVLAAYGEELRALPEARGRGLVAWVVPPLALLLGVIGLIVGLRRFTGAPDGRVEDGPEISEEERERLEEALDELEREEEPLF